jgi:hypothetical protein
MTNGRTWSRRGSIASRRRSTYRLLPPGPDRVLGGGRPARTRRTLRRERQGADRGHAQSSGFPPCCRIACRPRSSSHSICRKDPKFVFQILL